MNSKYVEDLDYLVNSLKSIHPDLFRKCSEEEFNNKINEIKVMELDDNTFSLEVMKLLSLVGDPHTKVSNGGFKEVFKYKFIDDRLYVLDDFVNLESPYINKEVVSINNIPLNEVINRINEYISYDNNSGKKKLVLEMLNNMPFMKGMFNSEELIFSCSDGKETVRFDYSKEAVKPLVKYDPKLLRTTLDDDTMYIKYGTCDLHIDNSIPDFIANTMFEVQEKNPSKVIVDLRNNIGGNSTFFMTLLDVLKDVKNKTTIVDERTFSSGIIAMNQMKNIGSKVVGEEVASAKNHFGECKKINLPNSNVRVMCSTAEFVYFDGSLIKITKEEKLADDKVKVNIFGVDRVVTKSFLSARESFELDETITPSIDEYRIYGDPVLYKVINEINAMTISNDQSRIQEKNVVRKLVPMEEENKQSGFVSTLVLSLLTGFAMGIVATLAYIFINK